MFILAFRRNLFESLKWGAVLSLGISEAGLKWFWAFKKASLLTKALTQKYMNKTEQSLMVCG